MSSEWASEKVSRGRMPISTRCCVPPQVPNGWWPGRYEPCRGRCRCSPRCSRTLTDGSTRTCRSTPTLTNCTWSNTSTRKRNDFIVISSECGRTEHAFRAWRATARRASTITAGPCDRCYWPCHRSWVKNRGPSTMTRSQRLRGAQGILNTLGRWANWCGWGQWAAKA